MFVEESSPAACEYAYNPLAASALSPQNKECADLMASQSNHSQSADDCFSSARANLDQLLELNKKQEYTCFILTSSKRQCDATASCKYTADFNDASAQVTLSAKKYKDLKIIEACLTVYLFSVDKPRSHWLL